MVDVDDDDKSGVRVWGELVRPVTAARTERDSMLFSLDNQCRRGKSEWGGRDGGDDEDKRRDG